MLVQEVMAAITTSPWPRSKFLPFTGTRRCASAPLPYSLSSASAKADAALRERHAILRALRPGDRRLDRAKIERERRGEHGVGRRLLAVKALRAGISLDQSDARLLAPRGLEIGDGLLIDREEAAGRAIFRRHVGDGGAVLERQIVEAGAVELDELADHALAAQHLGDGQHEIGRGDAVAQARRSGGSRPLRGSAWRSAGRAWRPRPRCRRRPSRAPRGR